MLQYLEFMNKVHQINDAFDLNHHETRVLELIARANHLNHVLTIGDLTNQKQIASPATLHGVVQSLLKKRLAKVKINKNDRRIKSLSLTKESRKRFNELEGEMSRQTSI